MEQIHIDRLKAVLKANEGRDPSGFDMGHVLHPPHREACGTAACLLGAYLLSPAQKDFAPLAGYCARFLDIGSAREVRWDDDSVKSYFGLNDEEFDVVFLHDGPEACWDDDVIPRYGNGKRWTLDEKLSQVARFIAEKERELKG